MLEILSSCWSLLVGLLMSLWGVFCLVGVWAWEVLYHLHVSAPRLEGLLIGIALAWMMARRDKHPALRVLSSPLRLVIDILDLAWDQAAEVVSDLWQTVTGWVSGVYGWIKGKAVGGYNRVMNLLTSLKNRLSNLGKKDDEN